MAQGFVFAADAEGGPMLAAEAGTVVRNPDDGPPWIVVDRAIESIVVAKWPGRLWKVEVLKAASEQARAQAGYTRAVEVRVIEELPPALLFGPHGDAVLDVIAKASAATREQVSALERAADPEARAAYSRAWSRWLGDDESDDAHADTLAAFSRGGRSPIGSGFTVLHSVLAARAHGIAGETAFVEDEEGDPMFAPEWQSAVDAFLHAAMAFGAPEIASIDRRVLTAAWDAVFG
jgi:hypothetical protein